MNRPIKFRVWDGKKLREVYELGFRGYPIVATSRVSVLKENNSDYEDLNQFEISQYTGLLDKNKKEIYEGDIIRQQVLNTFGSYGPVDLAVMYCAHKGHWALTKTPEDPEKEHFVMGNMEERGEVIGNIYETPDLLG